MIRQRKLGIGLILCLAALISCGTDNGSTSPKAIDGVLLHASDLPDMRLEAHDSIDQEAGLAEILGGPEACSCPTVFKDDVPVVIDKLHGFGFKRGYTELWTGAGLHGSAFAAEFDTTDHAKAALDYMRSELNRECVGEDFCSNRARINNVGIPDSFGLAVTPLRPADQGRRSTLYKFLFQIKTIVYGVMDGASGAFDPGTVSQAQALAVVKLVYDRVKDREIADVLKSAPPSPYKPEGPPSPPPSPK